MSDAHELIAETRTATGKGANRRLRRLDNRIPAVIYGAGKDTLSLTLDHNKMIHALENESFYSSILTINIDGKKEKAVLKGLQRHPHKPKVLHVDFFRVSATEALTMKVPLHLKGEEVAPGVKQEGGIVQRAMTEIEIRCLPADLPEFLELDISELALDSTLHLSDIVLPQGVEIVELTFGEEHDQSVVSIHLPRAALEPEEEVEAQAEEGAAEGEGESSEAKPEEGEGAEGEGKEGSE